jgi:Pyridoxamine 5'-phosphate oxidase
MLTLYVRGLSWTTMTRFELYKFMAGHALGVLGSISAEGMPQSSLVGIAVTKELEIIFDTLDSTRKYRNLFSNSKASFVVGWEGETTVQFEGEAFLLEGEDRERYKSVYFAKWPDGPSRQNWPGLVYFVVRPRWIRYSDFNARPPLIEEHVFAR